jgi:hypothetical protein
MDKKKRTIWLVIIGISIIGLLVALYFVLREQNNPYVKDPISQNSLSFENKKIVLNNIEVEESDGVLYEVSSKVILDKVETFVQRVDSKLQQIKKEEGSYYEWANGTSYVIYDLVDNTVSFNIEKGITWDEVNITEYSFAQFAKEYFDKDWTYTISTSEKMSDGGTVSYASRKVGDFKVATILKNQSTDYLVIKNGKITYGKFLVTEFIEAEKKVPLISATDLKIYINASGYPKEIHPEFGTIQTTILTEIDYKGDEFESVVKTLANCKSTSLNIVYLYKSLDQGNLTPVYKLDLQCELTYKDVVYTIPAIGYVNAINPEYVSTKE